MSADATTEAPTARKKLAQAKHAAPAADAALGHDHQNPTAPTGHKMTAQGNALGKPPPTMSSPEGAKEGGKLPDGWQRKTLGESCEILAGFGFPEHLQGKTEGDLPFFKVGDISETWKRGEVHLTKANHYLSRAEATGIRAKPLPMNTTVFAKIGAAIALNRRAILSEPALVDNNVMGLHPATEALDHKFLFHFMCTVKLDELSRATTVPSVRKSDIERIWFPLPPLPEQRRIVAEIEKQFTRLEAGVAALRRVQANLKRYRAAVLKAACEGKLVPTEAELTAKHTKSAKKNSGSVSASSALSAVKSPGYETGAELLARILAERRKDWLAHRNLGEGGTGRGKYKEPTPLDAKNLPKLPAGWTWATLDQIAQEGRPIIYGIIKPGPHIPDGVPYVRVTEMKDGRIDVAGLRRASKERAATFARATLAPGDVLISKDGTIGRVAVVPPELAGGNITQHVMRAPIHSIMNRDFVVWAIRSDWCQHWLTGETRGVALRGVNVEDFRRLPIPLPPLAEQTRIVAEVERRLSVVEELESVVSANLQRASRLRQSILQKAFSGELV